LKGISTKRIDGTAIAQAIAMDRISSSMNASSRFGQQSPADVLIVEDESVSRRALTSLLASSGYTPAAYESAEEALEDVDGGPLPRVALVDVDLPGMSGLDLAARLEQIDPQVRTVLITATEGDRIDRFRQVHGVHYLRKPLDFPRLLSLLACCGPQQ